MDNRAATEALGTVLLVAIVVLLSTTAGAAVFAQTFALQEDADRTQLNIETDINTTAVTIQHVGGPEFETKSLTILLRGNSGREGPYLLNESAVTGSGLTDGTFETGDTATVTHSFTGLVEVSLYYPETGERLYRTLRSAQPPAEIPTPGAGDDSPTARASALDQLAEGYSITLDGSESTASDGSIVSYSWTITSGSGSVVEDDTATPNATYVAPDDVSSDQNVTIELTVTDDDGNTDTTTVQTTVVDTDTADAPLDDNGDGAAFDDPNGNGVYDEGENVISEEELEDGFNDPTVDLVVYPSVGEVKSTGSAVDITANTITAGNDFRATGDTIQMTAEGDINLDGATLESNGNDGIIITSRNGTISAVDSTMTSSSGPVAFNANGDIDLRSATLDGKSYTADLSVSSATLFVDQLSLKKKQDTLVYDPDDITVNGTPGQGSVSPA